MKEIWECYVNSDLKLREQCISVRNKANRVLDFINRTVTNRSADVILRLYLALVRPHLDYAVQELLCVPYPQGSWRLPILLKHCV